MITRIVLKNFQRYKKLDLTLGQITTFVGDTDSGKSTIVRALRWVMTNSPKGNAFVRHGSKKECSVTLYVDDHVIKRSRSGSVNTYTMDGQTYHSFATGVPEPIQQVLRIKEENFQQQHDPIFWLSLSPAEVSKRLNEIADLQVMDDSIRASLSIKKEAQHRVKFCRENKLKAKESLSRLAEVPDLLAAFERLQERRQVLTQSLQNATRLRNRLAIGVEACQTVARLQKPHDLMGRLAVEERELKDNQLLVGRLRVLVCLAKQDVPANVGIETKLSLLKGKQDKFDRLQELAITYLDNQKKETQCQSRLESLKASISKVSAICPSCGRPLT